MSGPEGVGHRDRIAPLIPWYVNGTLDDRERAEVSRHLLECADCRSLLEVATRQRETAPAGEHADHALHVHSRILVRYAEDPAAFDAQARVEIEDRLAACSTCRDALALLHGVERQIALEQAGQAAPAPSWNERAFRWLAGSLLRPAPALAYLILLACLVPYALRRAPVADATPVFVAPRFATLDSDRALRDAAAATPGPPAEIHVAPKAGAPLLLGLRSDITRADLERFAAAPDAAAIRFRVEFSRGDELLLADEYGLEDLARDTDPIVFPVLVSQDHLEAGTTYRLRVRVLRPGDPLDGQSLFTRQLRIFSEPLPAGSASPASGGGP